MLLVHHINEGFKSLLVKSNQVRHQTIALLRKGLASSVVHASPHEKTVIRINERSIHQFPPFPPFTMADADAPNAPEAGLAPAVAANAPGIVGDGISENFG
jgi:hypothetical protein